MQLSVMLAVQLMVLGQVVTDAGLDVDDIQEQISKMLSSSPVEDAEEYDIHDFDGYWYCECQYQLFFKLCLIL
ncbi:MAG: hypothetical protein MI976_11555 [Pseudomonadales bacterium]|nr:hypothetical protein [Pseudomonadales bacterium]